MVHKLPLTIVVNGQPTSLEANLEEPLGALIPRALEQTGNTGQPPDQWELRDAAGDILDVRRRWALSTSRLARPSSSTCGPV